MSGWRTQLPDVSRSSEDWAYLAGFFDGEGCIQVTLGRVRGTGRQHQLRLTLSQAHTDVAVQWCLKMFGGHVQAYQKGDGTVRFTWGVYSRDHAQEVLAGMLPYLKMKRDQAEAAFEGRPDAVMRQALQTLRTKVKA